MPSDVVRPEQNRADAAQRETANDEAEIEMSEIQLSAAPESGSFAQEAGNKYFP